jgi:hypothetical protein
LAAGLLFEVDVRQRGPVVVADYIGDHVFEIARTARTKTPRLKPTTIPMVKLIMSHKLPTVATQQLPIERCERMRGLGPLSDRRSFNSVPG